MFYSNVIHTLHTFIYKVDSKNSSIAPLRLIPPLVSVSVRRAAGCPEAFPFLSSWQGHGPDPKICYSTASYANDDPNNPGCSSWCCMDDSCTASSCTVQSCADAPSDCELCYRSIVPSPSPRLSLVPPPVLSSVLPPPLPYSLLYSLHL